MHSLDRPALCYFSAPHRPVRNSIGFMKIVQKVNTVKPRLWVHEKHVSNSLRIRRRIKHRALAHIFLFQKLHLSRIGSIYPNKNSHYRVIQFMYNTCLVFNTVPNREIDSRRGNSAIDNARQTQ